MGELKITIQHSLPGRLRLKLSKPPFNWEKNNMNIKKHEGINSVYFSHITKTILIYFDTSVITKEEIILRASLALSVEYNMEPVTIEKGIESVGLDGFVYLSGLSIITTAILHGFTPMNMGRIVGLKADLSHFTGLLTAFAIINHGRKEIKRSGVFDPEVLSILYLIPSLVRKNVLVASGITWLATFGRHFLFNVEESLVLRAVKVNSEAKEPTYDVAITSDKNSIELKNIVKTIPIIIADGLLGFGIGKAKMLQSMKKISSSHNFQLEGLEGTNSRILIKI